MTVDWERYRSQYPAQEGDNTGLQRAAQYIYCIHATFLLLEMKYLPLIWSSFQVGKNNLKKSDSKGTALWWTWSAQPHFFSIKTDECTVSSKCDDFLSFFFCGLLILPNACHIDHTEPDVKSNLLFYKYSSDGFSSCFLDQKNFLMKCETFLLKICSFLLISNRIFVYLKCLTNMSWIRSKNLKFVVNFIEIVWECANVAKRMLTG